MKKVVIVDDEYLVVKGIQAMIAKENMDFEVIGHALNGLDGFSVITEQKPDLVICDIRMPGMDGLSLIEAVKESCPRTVFVILSGYQEFEYARRALLLGVKGYIDKPITMEKVRETLRMTEEVLNKEAENEEMKKKKYQDAYGQLNCLILQASDTDSEFNGLLEKTLQAMKDYLPFLEDYKEESYKILCMSLGIFYERRKERKEEQHFPSFQNIERLESKEEVDEITKQFYKRIFQKLREESMGGMHRTIKQLLEYINSHYDQDIGLAELAELVEMNPAYLSILFKEEVGMSYIKYLTKVRIDAAKKLLEEGYKVIEVSEKVGYSNYRYFCDIFKKQAGQTPSEYKGNVRRK